jgi:hypothetical protein
MQFSMFICITMATTDKSPIHTTFHSQGVMKYGNTLVQKQYPKKKDLSMYTFLVPQIKR